MKLYRVIVLREDKENIERGVWADRMELQGESILFITEEDNKLVGLYPARYTVVTSVETKEEFDKRKASL